MAAAGSLSRRGAAMAQGGLSEYIRVQFDRRHDAGYVGLCVAENHQVFELLRPKLESIPPVPPHVAAYDMMAGKDSLRQAIADLFTDLVFGRTVDPAHVQVLAGAGGVLDALGHALGDPGDGVLVPTPSYSGFWPDLQIRPGLRIVPVPTSAADAWRLTPAVLERAWRLAEMPIRILLLTNPDNPRGQLVMEEDLGAALAWAADKGLHVIADEVYALSTFGSEPFTSVGRLRPSLGDQLHVVWGFSKDFAMSGLRCGVVISENEALRQTLELQGSWAGVSGHTQHLLAAMLSDTAWLEGYLAEMRTRLRSAAEVVCARLHEGEIPHCPPEAGFFVLCDLREFLEEPTWEAEHHLWARILDQAGVNLTPGSALRAPEPGWFRLCYATNPIDVVEAAIRRMVDVLRR